MEFNDVFYLVLGGLIGYRIAKLELNLDTIKKEVDEVDALMKRKNQSGFINVRSIIIAILLVSTSVSAIFAGIANKHSNDAVNRMETIGYCSQTTLGDLLISVKARSANTKPLAETNIEFQKSFRALMGELLHVPPFSSAQNFKTAKHFYGNQGEYIQKSEEQLADVRDNPLPTIDQYNNCLQNRQIK